MHEKNAWGDATCGSPCPSMGSHRYVFTVYASDTMLLLEAGTSKTQVVNAMSGHVLGKGELVGIYRR